MGEGKKEVVILIENSSTNNIESHCVVSVCDFINEILYILVLLRVKQKKRDSIENRGDRLESCPIFCETVRHLSVYKISMLFTLIRWIVCIQATKCDSIPNRCKFTTNWFMLDLVQKKFKKKPKPKKKIFVSHHRINFVKMCAKAIAI